MKKFWRVISFILSLSLISAGLCGCHGITGNSEPENSADNSSEESNTSQAPFDYAAKSQISGTFIQPWLYSSWSDKRWNQEIEVWKNLGIDSVIMGDTAFYDLSTKKLTTAYPTEIEGAVCTGDVTTKLFDKCKENGLKLYIGIGNTPAGWPYLGFETESNKQVFKDVCALYASIAEDIYKRYGTDYADVFAGFYFVPEMYNSYMFDTDPTRTKYVEGMAGGLNIIFEKLNELNPDLPFIFSPYVNIFGGSWVSKNSVNIGKFWKEFLATVNFRDGDILCPQDSVGAGGMDIDHLEEYTAMYKKAVTDCGKKIHFWSNCETFVQPSGDYYSLSDDVSYWGSCSVERMVKQFEIVGKYAEKTVTFAFPHYQSPYNNVDGYYTTYLDYLEHGVLESEKPKAPDTFRTLKQTISINGESKEVLRVMWSGMYDNFGVWKVNIYKNGKLLTYRYTTRADAGALYPNSFYDADYDFENDTVTYEIEVIDCAGNIGDRVSFTVEAGSVPNGVKLGSAYRGPDKK